MRRALARPAALLAALTAFGAAALAAGPAANAASARSSSMALEVTFYGAPDNDPPGGTIAHPVKHRLAGGVGTWADPVTFASDTSEFPVGSRIYYRPLRKYFLMEDDCAPCISQWNANRHYHVDLWAGYDAGVIACEDHLTPVAGSIVAHPSSTEPVDVTPIYAKGRCVR